VLLDLGRVAEAEAAMQEALELCRGGGGAANVAGNQHALSNIQLAAGRWDASSATLAALGEHVARPPRPPPRACDSPPR